MSETSIKGLIQSLAGDAIEVLQGIVVSDSPLKIQAVNDEKLILSERVVVVPQQFTDYTVDAMFSGGEDDGAGDGEEENGEQESDDGDDGQEVEDSGDDGGAATMGTLTVYNALKAGEKVYLLAVNHGKVYIVLGRVRE